ncbi:MAG: pyruvate dehydrogenase complex dihydrolipoamide acetyltransferase [Rhodospirillales bacterium]|nr:MAG: pyruvate dehydrogenase complex dihydrolipoamide acetyltransferase [Rhodospirillales bacterium]
MPIQVLMPALSPTMTEGKLAKWLKKEGDTVESGDVLAEIETDKATMEVEAVEEGVLGRILVSEGTEGVAVNAPIALLLEEGEDESALDQAAVEAGRVAAEAPKGEAAAPEPAKSEPMPAAQPAQPPAQPPVQPHAKPAAAEAPQRAAGERIFASPLARRLAAEAGLDLAAIAGTGPHGRIVKRDIETAKAEAAARPAAPEAPAPAAAAPAAAEPAKAAIPEPTSPFREVPNTTMRKVIAQRLSASKREIPHYYLTIHCCLDAVMELRQELNARSPEGEGAYKLSVNDFVVRAVALALRRYPEANSSWTDDAIRLFETVDVAVAVDSPGGLITPVVRNADHKGLAAISNEVKALAAKAREGRLAPEDYQGGGFTVSNLGMFGISEFAAIINPPQSCLMSVGAAEQRPVVRDGALAVATMMSCTLSADHRSVDGARGAEFLAIFKGLIEEPLTMLL